MRAWHKNWIYVSGLSNCLPPHFGGGPELLRSWTSLDAISNDTKLLLDATTRLKDRGLKGIHIMRTWVELRVLPLQARTELMCTYRGPTDPSRVSPDELGEEELRCRLSLLTSLEADGVSLEVVVDPFQQGFPLAEVGFRSSNFVE